MIRGFPEEKARNPIVTLRPASEFNVMILTVSHFWVFDLRKCGTVVNFSPSVNENVELSSILELESVKM